MVYPSYLFAPTTQHQQQEKVLVFLLFSCFSHLFSLIPTFSTYFLASISHVPDFYKLICHLQWGTHTCLADGKVNKNKLMAMLLIGIG